MRKIVLLLGFWFISGLSLQAQFVLCNSSTTKDLNDVFFINESIGIAVGNLGVILRSTDGGLNWLVVNDSGPFYGFTKVRFFDEQHGIAIGSDILTTDDAGQTWTSQGMAGSYFYDMSVLSNTTCIVTGQHPGVIKSTDLGNTWDTLVLENGHVDFAILSFVDEQVGYSCRTFGEPINQVQKTTDGGLSWVPYLSESGSVNSVIEAMTFISEDVGFRAGWYNPSFSRTIDGATNWIEVEAGVDTNANHLLEKAILDFEISASMPNSYYACGWYGEIYKSIDGGQYWFYLNSGTKENLRSIFFINDNLGWVVGDNGLILKTTKGGVTANVELDKKPFDLYPNPVDDVLHLGFSASEIIRQVQVSTILGQVVAVFDGNQSEIDIHFLPQGTYLVKVLTHSSQYSELVFKK